MLEMEKAAKNGELYHLWWHPHNFSVNTAENISQVEKIISHYKELNSKYGFESLNMGEIAAYVSK